MADKEAKEVKQLVDLEVNEVSLVDKPAILRTFVLVKREGGTMADDAKQAEEEEKAKAPEEDADKVKAEGDAPPAEGPPGPPEKAEDEDPKPADSDEGPELGDAVAIALPAIIEMADTLEAGEVKSAVALVLAHLEPLAKREKKKTKAEQAKDDEEKAKAKEEEEEEKSKGTAIDPILTPFMQALEQVNANLAKVGEALKGNAAATTKMEKRLDRIEKARPVAKSEGTGGTTKVEKVDEVGNLFGGIFPLGKQ